MIRFGQFFLDLGRIIILHPQKTFDSLRLWDKAWRSEM